MAIILSKQLGLAADFTKRLSTLYILLGVLLLLAFIRASCQDLSYDLTLATLSWLVTRLVNQVSIAFTWWAQARRRKLLMRSSWIKFENDFALAMRHWASLVFDRHLSRTYISFT